MKLQQFGYKQTAAARTLAQAIALRAERAARARLVVAPPMQKKAQAKALSL